MSDKYILDGKMPRKAESLEEWARWFAAADRCVAGDSLFGEVTVSTVFLGIDHSWNGPPPLIFETMIFGGPHDGYQTRAATWDQAEKQHAEAIKVAKDESH